MSHAFTALPKRLLILGGVATLLAIILIAKWIGGWGLVTIHVQEAPLGKVMASIARQGHVRVEGSLDPLKPVSLDCDRVTPAEALDMLAIRSDASWRVVYLVAPKKADLDSGLIQLRASTNVENWTSAYYPGSRYQEGGVSVVSGEIIDPRSLDWKPEGPELSIPALLDEAAQKTGVMTLLPKDWNPTTRKLPKTSSVSKAIAALVGSVKGKSLELFLLCERDRMSRLEGGEPTPPSNEGNTPQQVDSQQVNSQSLPPLPKPTIKPEWMAQRQSAQIKKLPLAQQASAKVEIDERKAFFNSLQGLTPEERRAKVQARMADPAVAEKMQDSRLLREAKLTPQQRVTRAVNYLNRKEAAKASAATSSPGQ